MEPLTPLSILLVDDDENDFIRLRRLLTVIPGKRIKIDWSLAFEESLQKASGYRFDAILLDYSLGERDGVQWIQEARRRGVDAPVIFLGGGDSFENNVEAMRAGAADFISREEMNGFLIERSIRYAIERNDRKHTLERRVQERTAELQALVEDLANSLEEMRVPEDELREQNRLREEALINESESQLDYQDLLENAPVAFLLVDDTGKVRYANSLAEALLNRPIKRILGIPVSIFIYAKDLVLFLNRVASVRINGRPDRLAIKIRPHKQEPVEVNLYMAPTRADPRFPRMVQLYFFEKGNSEI